MPEERTVNDELFDGVVQHDHYLIGVEAYALFMWLGMFNRGVEDAQAIIMVAGMGGGRLTDLPPAALRDALHRADIALANAADLANDSLVETLMRTFSGQGEALINLLRKILPDNVDLTAYRGMTRADVYNLLNRPVYGKSLVTRLKEIVTAARQLLYDAVASVMSAGGTAMDLLRRLRDLVVNKIYRPLEKLIRTEVQRAATLAAIYAYKQQAALFSALLWVTTLDDRTCAECENLHGTVYSFDKSKSPTVDDIPPQPVHPHCRCTLVPTVVAATSMGLPENWRLDGALPSVPFYPEWFLRQKEYVRERILGCNRYALFTAGKLKVKSAWTALPRTVGRVDPDDLPKLLRFED